MDINAVIGILLHLDGSTLVLLGDDFLPFWDAANGELSSGGCASCKGLSRTVFNDLNGGRRNICG